MRLLDKNIDPIVVGMEKNKQDRPELCNEK